MQDSFASWMITGGPREAEHDQLVAHRLVLRELRREASDARRAAFVGRIRARFLRASIRPVETLDCCVA